MPFIRILFLCFLLFAHPVFAQGWSVGWTSLALRPLPVYYDHQSWRDVQLQQEALLAYDFSKSQTGFQKIQVRTAYLHPLKPVSDLDFFGFQDLEAVLLYAFHPSFRMFISGLLPLSKSSVKQPLVTAGSLGFSYFFSFSKEQKELLNLSFRHFLSLNAHHNPLRSFLESYIYNDLVSLNHELNITGLSYAGFTLESSLILQNFYTYSRQFHHAWSAEARLLYSWKNLQLMASYVRKWNPYDKIMLRIQPIYPSLFLAGASLKWEL